jgi:hypothetical protein
MTTHTISGIYAGTYTLSPPITILSITSTGFVESGVVSGGASTYTIVNQGSIRAQYYAVSLAGGGVITNSGGIDALSVAKGDGIILGNGGRVTNTAAGKIIGYNGVEIGTSTGTVNNQGEILGTDKFGVLLAGGGVVTNGAAGDTSANIRGYVAIEAGLTGTVTNYGAVLGIGTTGIAGELLGGGAVVNGSASDKTALIAAYAYGLEIAGGAGLVDNFGSIRSAGTYSVGVGMGGGGSLTNGSSADSTALIEGGHFAIEIVGGAGTVTNFGTVRGAGGLSAGVLLKLGGVVTNGSTLDTTALIESQNDGVGIEGAAGTVKNFATIITAYTGSSVTSAGVYLTAGGSVTNGSAADTKAHIAGAQAVYINNAIGTVANFATLGGIQTEIGAFAKFGGLIVNGSASDTIAVIQGYVGVGASTHLGTLENFGTVLAGGGPGAIATQEAAAYFTAGGLVTNGSSADFKASMSGGNVGVKMKAVVSTLTNFGSIGADEEAAYLGAGGRITNGSAADTGARMTGGLAGIDVEGGAGTVTNFATILGGPAPYFAVKLGSGGLVTNGSATDHVAMIKGFDGVTLTGGAVVNHATISGEAVYDSFGVVLNGGVLTNEAGALVIGYDGALAGAGSTIVNFGAIASAFGGGNALLLSGPTSRLDAEAGSVFVGEINAGSGVVDVVGGVATAAGLVSSGVVTGAGTLSLAGTVSLLETGVSLSVSKIIAGSGEIVDVTGKVSDGKIWDQTAGATLDVLTGDQMTFTGTGDSFSGVLEGPGTIAFNAGTDAFSALDISAAKVIISKAAVTLSGTITLATTLSVATPNLIVAAGGATLAGGGTIALSNAATNSLHGASSAAKLTNEDLIRGAGHLGGGTMILDNAVSGIIDGVGSAGLTIDTGANTIANAGTIEAATGSVTTIAGAVANTGLLESAGGTLVVEGAVTGTGSAKVSGGEVFFSGTFNEAVAFGPSGRLKLAGQGYTAAITGFSHTGTTSLDLTDITFSGGTMATYSGTSAAGVLTVTDGTHTAHIHFTGNYLAAIWTLSNDGTGHTLVVDPTAPKPHIIVAAMAGMGAAPPGGTRADGSAHTLPPPTLAAPGG